MTARFPVRSMIALAVMTLTAVAPHAQERLVIDVGKSKRSASSSNVVHYQGTGSVRHSDQRTYESAQERHSVQATQNRSASTADEGRTIVGAEDRKEEQGAEDRTIGHATDRHGSVHLDTVR